MTTLTQSDEAAEKVRDQPIVDEAWVADRGYVIAILDRTGTHGSIYQLIDLAKHLGLDGEINIVPDFMHDGQERDSVHLIAENR